AMTDRQALVLRRRYAEAKLLQEIRERHRHDRNIRNDHQRDQIDDQIRNDSLVNFRDRHLEHQVGGKDVQTERRHEHPDAQVDGEDDAKMDRADVHGFGDTHAERCQDQDGRRRLEEAADKQQDDVHQQQSDDRPGVERADIIDELLRNAAGGQQPGIDAGAGDDQQDLGRQIGRAHHDTAEVRPRDLPINEFGNDDRIDDGNARGLGGREDAAIDAAEDDADGAV